MRGIVIVPVQALPLELELIEKIPSDEMKKVGRLNAVPKIVASPVIVSEVALAGVEQLESVQFVKIAFRTRSATPILRSPSAAR